VGIVDEIANGAMRTLDLTERRGHRIGIGDVTRQHVHACRLITVKHATRCCSRKPHDEVPLSHERACNAGTEAQAKSSDDTDWSPVHHAAPTMAAAITSVAPRPARNMRVRTTGTPAT
jgi:hypothetical protein